MTDLIPHTVFGQLLCAHFMEFRGLSTNQPTNQQINKQTN